MSEDLRRCPRCMEIRRFLNLRCTSCRYRNGELAEMPPIYSERCPRCRRLVAATIGGFCGLCAARSEYDRRKRVGTLSRSDRTEMMCVKTYSTRKGLEIIRRSLYKHKKRRPNAGSMPGARGQPTIGVVELPRALLMDRD